MQRLYQETSKYSISLAAAAAAAEEHLICRTVNKSFLWTKLWTPDILMI